MKSSNFPSFISRKVIIMNKPRLIIPVVLVSLLLLLIAGCQIPSIDSPTEPSVSTVPPQPTEPSIESTEPAVTELELLLEKIKTSVREGIAYSEVFAMFGTPYDESTSDDPMNRFQFVWFLEETGHEGTYLEVQFLYPGYDSLEDWRNDWAASSGIPTKTYSDGTVVYDFTGIDYLAVWIDGMEATTAMIRKDGQTVEVLFGEDYYGSPPTEDTVAPRTIEYFKSHLTPHMTHGKAKELFGRWDFYRNDQKYIYAEWDLESDYYVSVHFYPVANEYVHEYQATEPTAPNGEDYGLIYYGEWNRHMEAYIVKLCRRNPYEVVEVWFDLEPPVWSGK